MRVHGAQQPWGSGVSTARASSSHFGRCQTSPTAFKGQHSNTLVAFAISWAGKLHFLSLQTRLCQGGAEAPIRHSQILLTKWNNQGWSLTCKASSVLDRQLEKHPDSQEESAWIWVGFYSLDFGNLPIADLSPCSALSSSSTPAPSQGGSWCGTHNSLSPRALGRWGSLPCFPGAEIQAKVNKCLV